jgi:sugar/nucleoside kinase (ribokinase family)
MIVGFGENSVDFVYRLPGYPQPGAATSKARIERRDVRAGGQVATTLATCAALGRPTRYVGTFGDDANGDVVREELAARGVDVHAARIRHAPNRYAVILMDSASGERVVLWDRDPRLAIQPHEVRREWLDDALLVHLDATDEAAAIELVRLATAAGLPVTCDIDAVTPQTRQLLQAVTIPILAEHVPAALTGEQDLTRALRMLRAQHPGTLVVTLGARGSAMLDDDRFYLVPGFAVDVIDTTGAGDIFRGAFIHALLRGDGPDEILRFANAAAAVGCTKEGAIGGVPTLEEIDALLSA